MNEQDFPLVGILGGGQLGRMLALAGIRMGVRVRFLAPSPAGPMMGLGEQVVGDWTDEEVIRRFLSGCSVVTSESEWAPADHVASVSDIPVYPLPETLQVIRHKGVQKRVLAEAGLPLPSFRSAATVEEAISAAEALGFPVVLKKHMGSYDGYGNATVSDATGLREAWTDLADQDGLLVEQWVGFERELSVLIARRPDGAHVTYPVAHTIQKDHRCHLVNVPGDVEPAIAREAIRVAHDAVEAVNGIGITAVELFELSDGRVLINELAPRPHNTGHYSIEACYASQFENHLRAILGWPLGSPDLREPAAVMVNVLGTRTGVPSLAGWSSALGVPGVAVHIYGKERVEPRRKMGHVTATGSDLAETRARALRAAESIIL